jgi:hypothetical protein
MNKNWNPLNWVTSSAITALLIAGGWTGQNAAHPAIASPATANSQQAGLTYQLKTLYSRGMGKSRPYGVILPPHYSEEPQRRYPVIFFLHGGKGTSSSWIDIGLLPVLQKLYQEGKLPPSIVILPDGNDNRSRIPKYDPDYYDGPYGKVSTLIGQELPIVSCRSNTVQPATPICGRLEDSRQGVGVPLISVYGISIGFAYFLATLGTSPIRADFAIVPKLLSKPCLPTS